MVRQLVDGPPASTAAKVGRRPRSEAKPPLETGVADEDAVDKNGETSSGPISTTRLRARRNVPVEAVPPTEPLPQPPSEADRLASMFLRWACEVELGGGCAGSAFAEPPPPMLAEALAGGDADANADARVKDAIERSRARRVRAQGRSR